MLYDDNDVNTEGLFDESTSEAFQVHFSPSIFFYLLNLSLRLFHMLFCLKLTASYLKQNFMQELQQPPLEVEQQPPAGNLLDGNAIPPPEQQPQ